MITLIIWIKCFVTHNNYIPFKHNWIQKYDRCDLEQKTEVK